MAANRARIAGVFSYMKLKYTEACLTLWLMSFLAACGQQTPHEAGSLVIIGDSPFFVPNEYVGTSELSSINTETLRQLPKLRIPIDSEPSEGLEVADNDKFTMELDISSGKSGLMQEAGDAWSGTSRFANNVLTKDRPRRLFRVYSRDDFPKAWHYFRDMPSKMALDKEWLSKCWVNNIQPEEESQGNISCQTETDFDSLKLTLHFSGTRIDCRDRIVERAKELLSSWKVEGKSAT